MKTSQTRSSGIQRLQTSKHDSVQFLIVKLSFQFERFMTFLGAYITKNIGPIGFDMFMLSLVRAVRCHTRGILQCGKTCEASQLYARANCMTVPLRPYMSMPVVNVFVLCCQNILS